jgi:NAD-dependent DNA ligase
MALSPIQRSELKNLKSLLQTIDVLDLQKVKKEADTCYDAGEILLSDQRYDILLEAIEAKIGSKPSTLIPVSEDSKKIKLPYWMGSMDKKKTQEEIDRWLQKQKSVFIVTPKLDGVSCLLQIRDNKIYLYTRGDGSIGSDISHLQQYIKGLPKVNMSTKASTKGSTDITIRGELMISHSDFEQFKHDFKNARQLVSGTVNSKNVRKEVASCIEFIGYEDIREGINVLDLQQISSSVVPFITLKKKDINTEKLTAIIADWRSSLPYYIDGIVITTSEPYQRNTSGNPDYAFAFKINSLEDMVETAVIDISWNVSKRGLIKPTVRLDPVDVGGVTIQNATGFNAKFITENHVGKGAVVQIVRSGDVIPHIVSVIRKGVPNLPEIAYEWNETHVDFIVKDQENDDMKRSTLTYFFKKIGVKSVSTQTIAHLYEEGLTTILDILQASPEDYNMGDVISGKIHKNIKASMKEASLSCLIAASGLLGSGMGEKKIDMLLEELPNFFNDDSPSKTLITSVKGFSDKTASVVIENLDTVKEFLKEMEPFRQKVVVNDVVNNDVVNNHVVKDHVVKEKKKVVFSGFRDAALEKKCKENNIEVMTSISKNTDILIVKDPSKTSQKIDKAIGLGVEIMSVDEFVSSSF